MTMAILEQCDIKLARADQLVDRMFDAVEQYGQTPPAATIVVMCLTDVTRLLGETLTDLKAIEHSPKTPIMRALYAKMMDRATQVQEKLRQFGGSIVV